MPVVGSISLSRRGAASRDPLFSGNSFPRAESDQRPREHPGRNTVTLLGSAALECARFRHALCVRECA